MGKPRKARTAAKDGPSNRREIIGFVHCTLCMEERPASVAPRDWAKIEVG